MALSSNLYALKLQRLEKILAQTAAPKVPNGQVMAYFARSPKTRDFWKSAKGGPKEILQKSPESSHRLKGPKARCRKWNYPLISMLLKCKDWKRFWRKQRLQKCPNGQVIAIFARSPKTRIFWKIKKGGPTEIFQKSPKNQPSLERPKSTLAQMALSFN